MEKYFSKKLILLLTVIASFVIICISTIQFYLEYREYNLDSEKAINARVERIASSILPSVWELYKKSVERKFSDDFSSKVLDSEIRSEGVDAIVIRGQFGHFYMGRYKSIANEGSDVTVNSFKDLNDYQRRFKNSIFTFPIKNMGMTIGSVEIVRNDTSFKNKLRKKIIINIVETIIITTSFFLLTIYGVNRSLMGPLKEISLATKTINILNEGVFYLNEDFSIKDSNDPALKILKIGKDSLVGKNSLELFELNSISIAKSLEIDDYINTEAHLFVDNVKHFFQIFIVKVYDEKDEFLNFALKFQDVSDLKTMMHSLRDAKEEAEQANKRKSSFLANMSHEIRTPLNSICGLSSYIVDNSDIKSEELNDHLKSINTSSEHLLSVINNIIDFSKVEDSKVVLERHEFSLSEKIEELVSTFSLLIKAKKLNLVLENDLKGKRYFGDSYRLSQIVNNLISNAIKFTGIGEVKVKLSSHKLNDNQEEILIEVIDNGIGVPIEAQDKLFDAYIQADQSTTRQFGGTGLGLSISKELASLFNGELGFKENPIKGSTFFFKFPMELARGSSVENVISVEAIPLLEDLKVLVVDDEKINRTLLNLYFKKDKNIEVTMAVNGQEAFDLFKEVCPDIVLLDLHMPVMDGEESLKRMREHERENKLDPSIIFIVSANTLSESAITLKEGGADSYLVKPISSRKLKSEIVKFIKT